jgi:hypothetical protein
LQKAIQHTGGIALTIASILFLGIASSFAQIQKVPLQAESHQRNRNLFHARQQATRLTLPFWDDFSTAKGMYPNPSLWVDSAMVFINDGIAINPPTIKTATFDGINAKGVPYSPEQLTLTGFNDELTSLPINLSETAVPVAQRNSVFLSFFFQWQGNGEAPDDTDYLQVQFKNDTSEWVDVMAIYPLDYFDKTVFYDTMIQLMAIPVVGNQVLDGEQFFHEDFQFRFRNFGRQSGPFDTWNIDYVYLNAGRSINDTSYPERALATDLAPLFGEYTGVPYSQFKSSHPKIISSPSFDVQNLKSIPAPKSIDYQITASIANYIKGDTISGDFPLGQQGVRGDQGVMDALERVTVHSSLKPDTANTSQFHPEADSIDLTLKVKVLSGDEADDPTKFAPVDTRVNDTISQTFYLRNYFSYDDGVAEYSAGLVQPGQLAAYGFDMLDEPDNLTGLYVYFPPYGITANQNVTFTIYGDTNGKPGGIYQSFSTAARHVGLDTFQRVLFTPVAITQKRFYIGWEQPISGTAFIGLDTDNDTSDKMFQNETGASWDPVHGISGSFMIRPIFGESPDVEGPSGIEDRPQFSIFPNPSNGTFYIKGHFDRMKIYSTTGMDVSYDIEKSNEGATVKVTDSVRGLFLVRITRGQATTTERILITQ